MKFEIIYAAGLLGMCLIIAAINIDVNVTVNITDKPIINKLNNGGENKNLNTRTLRPVQE